MRDRAETLSWALTVAAFILLMASDDSNPLLVLAIALMGLSLAADAFFLLSRRRVRDGRAGPGDDVADARSDVPSHRALVGAGVFLVGSTLGVLLVAITDDRRLLLVGIALMLCGAVLFGDGLRRRGRR